MIGSWELNKESTIENWEERSMVLKSKNKNWDCNIKNWKLLINKFKLRQRVNK